MQVIGYGRVSTASGEQLSALRSQLAWLEDQGCDSVLHDVESGLHVDRPSYSTMLQLVRDGKVGTIRATRADRLGRDAAELIRLVELADASGVTIRTRDDGVLSAKTAEELLLLYVRAALAQGESMKISARIHGGLAQGRLLGKPMRRPCWGYQLSADRLRLEPHPEHFKPARGFIDTLIESDWRMMSSLKVRPEVPFKSIRGVTAWIRNPTIRGGIGYGQQPNHRFEQVLWDRHPAILTHDEFESYKAISAKNRRNWGSNAKRKLRPLTGLCICSECGFRLKYVAGRVHLGLRCNGDLCSQFYRSTREELIIRYALAQLTVQAAEAMAAAADQRISPEIIEIQRQIEALQRLQDPDTALIIKAKQERLASLQAAPQADHQMIKRIADPRWASLATRDDLILIFHGLIKSITITNQQPTAIELRL